MPNQTGPTSLAGKKRSSRNSYRHGIHSTIAALQPMESPADWEEHRDGIFDSLQPEGHFECDIVEEIAWLRWCKRRLIYYQQTLALRRIAGARADLQVADAYEQQTIAHGIFPEVSEDRVRLSKATRTLPEPDDLNLIMRYGAHIHRMQIQLQHELESMQARRRGEHTPLARLDITGAPTE